ncbi:hypothetical protein J2S49_001007 [Arcanobacterium wilhelmae]|uniref:Uncharacterized protein n=1 Tax=Arcanobacterium wilhelmae TaxID=1803177 RepID=A0ABT9NCK3_9ACTO|nr:hypothetical protein [Arcanobacterium wilhelmae]MDP9800931.1 hypothetical protein [Arcanobacterium wilhelmae]WFN90291.1 hypothetical protein P8A24_00070 [Arcanobacterium wilhelmae]
MVSLGANAHDLDFDFSVARSVASTFTAVASTLESQAASRASCESTASGQFRGYFSQLFTSNMASAQADRDEIASALRDVAQGAQDIAQAAREENERRRVAHEYVTKHDNWWEKTWDYLFGQEPPPRLEVNPAPTIHTSAPPPEPRETPAPGASGGPNMGVSSASPADLKSAAQGLASLDESVAGKPAQLERALEDFAAS